MANSVAVGGDPKFKSLAPSIKKTALFVLRSLKKSGFHLEIYLVSGPSAPKPSSNVLAYPAVKGFPYPHVKNRRPLGEIFLNIPLIGKKRENPDQLLVHGICHLFGYNHKRKIDCLKMEKLEEKLWRRKTLSV